MIIQVVKKICTWRVLIYYTIKKQTISRSYNPLTEKKPQKLIANHKKMLQLVKSLADHAIRD